MTATVIGIRASTKGQFQPRTKPWEYDNYQVVLRTEAGDKRANVNPNNGSRYKKGKGPDDTAVSFSDLREGDVISEYRTFADDPETMVKMAQKGLHDPENVINTNFGFVLVRRGGDTDGQQ